MINEIPFVETPLHIAAFTGHIPFVMEIMRLKPSFARKLNQDGLSPMHLALQKHQALQMQNNPNVQNIQTMLMLLEQLSEVDKDLVRVQGKEGVAPFHYVAQMGNIKLLKKIWLDCPMSIKDVTIGRDTALHIALNNSQEKAFRFLVLLTVRFLLDCVGVDANIKNLEGLTSLDIVQSQMGSASRLTVRSWKFYLSYLDPSWFQIFVLRQRENMTIEMSSMLLVVLALFITSTYQATLSPLEGVWQDNSNSTVIPNNPGKVVMNETYFLLLYILILCALVQ
ncbi:ankyrin repeat-containing protein BDA1-like [Corylus avellana]|uniref:ankyrin repeat-containing protein BDA1-like n=1 Tax=Corylus avellana TaxID=13451 RepID=UPI00286D5259|nr:ankyrin repeat-containing protein BDA1-like [Corylus avellana]